MNKKADSKLLSIWLFIIFVLIGGLIVIGVFIYYSNQNDIRSVEALTLYNKLVDIISNNGYLKDEVSKDSYNIFNKELNKNVFRDNGDFYFKIEIFDKDKLVKSIVEGNKADFEVNCHLSGNSKFPGCYEKTFYLLNNDRKLKVHILTGSRNENS